MLEGNLADGHGCVSLGQGSGLERPQQPLTVFHGRKFPQLQRQCAGLVGSVVIFVSWPILPFHDVDRMPFQP